MKIRGRGVIPFERMDQPQLIPARRGLGTVGCIKLRWHADAHFLVSVVDLTPFLGNSVCWFWFQLSQTRKQALGEIGLLV